MSVPANRVPKRHGASLAHAIAQSKAIGDDKYQEPKVLIRKKTPKRGTGAGEDPWDKIRTSEMSIGPGTKVKRIELNEHGKPQETKPDSKYKRRATPEMCSLTPYGLPDGISTVYSLYDYRTDFKHEPDESERLRSPVKPLAHHYDDEILEIMPDKTAVETWRRLDTTRDTPDAEKAINEEYYRPLEVKVKDKSKPTTTKPSKTSIKPQPPEEIVNTPPPEENKPGSTASSSTDEEIVKPPSPKEIVKEPPPKQIAKKPPPKKIAKDPSPKRIVKTPTDNPPNEPRTLIKLTSPREPEKPPSPRPQKKSPIAKRHPIPPKCVKKIQPLKKPCCIKHPVIHPQKKSKSPQYCVPPAKMHPVSPKPVQASKKLHCKPEHLPKKEHPPKINPTKETSKNRPKSNGKTCDKDKDLKGILKKRCEKKKAKDEKRVSISKSHGHPDWDYGPYTSSHSDDYLNYLEHHDTHHAVPLDKYPPGSTYASHPTAAGSFGQPYPASGSLPHRPHPVHPNYGAPVNPNQYNMPYGQGYYPSNQNPYCNNQYPQYQNYGNHARHQGHPSCYHHETCGEYAHHTSRKNRNLFESDMVSMMPIRTHAFAAPYVPMKGNRKSSGSESECDQEVHRSKDENPVGFQYQARADCTTEVAVTVEPRKQPLWQTMLSCGFRPVINCQAPPYIMEANGNEQDYLYPSPDYYRKRERECRRMRRNYCSRRCPRQCPQTVRYLPALPSAPAPQNQNTSSFSPQQSYKQTKSQSYAYEHSKTSKSKKPHRSSSSSGSESSESQIEEETAGSSNPEQTALSSIYDSEIAGNNDDVDDTDCELDDSFELYNNSDD